MSVKLSFANFSKIRLWGKVVLKVEICVNKLDNSIEGVQEEPQSPNTIYQGHLKHDKSNQDRQYKSHNPKQQQQKKQQKKKKKKQQTNEATSFLFR